MASNDLFLRSDVDKGETSPDKDLRLRSDADKIPAAGYANDVFGVASANIGSVFGVATANISEVFGS